MNEKFNENAKAENYTNILGIALRLIVIDPSDFFKMKAGIIFYRTDVSMKHFPSPHPLLCPIHAILKSGGGLEGWACNDEPVI